MISASVTQVMITTVKKIMYLNAQIQNVCVMQALYQMICQSGNCLLIRILAANVEDTERSEEKWKNVNFAVVISG